MLQAKVDKHAAMRCAVDVAAAAREPRDDARAGDAGTSRRAAARRGAPRRLGARGRRRTTTPAGCCATRWRTATARCRPARARRSKWRATYLGAPYQWGGMTRARDRLLRPRPHGVPARRAARPARRVAAGGGGAAVDVARPGGIGVYGIQAARRPRGVLARRRAGSSTRPAETGSAWSRSRSPRSCAVRRRRASSASEKQVQYGLKLDFLRADRKPAWTLQSATRS